MLLIPHSRYRRILQVCMLLAGLVGVCYVCTHYLRGAITWPGPAISHQLTLAAGLLGLAAGVAYGHTPHSYTLPVGVVFYAGLLAVSGAIVVQTGGVGSPYAPLWIVVATLAAIFDIWGVILVAAVVHGYIAWALHQGDITMQHLLTAGIMAETPLLFSYMTWVIGQNPLSYDPDLAHLNKKIAHEYNKSDTVLQAIDDGVMLINKPGVITLMNPAAEQITGWPSESAVGQHFGAVLRLQDDTGTMLADNHNPVYAALDSLQPSHDSCPLLTRTESTVELDIAVAPLDDTAREGVIIIFRDITRERAEKRQQSEFISTASHEMRTPVASIEGYLGLALNPATASLDARARQYIDKAHAAAEHLGRLFQDLLDVTKADDGRLQSKPVVVDVVAFVRDIVGGLQGKAAAKGLKLIYRPDDGEAVAGTTIVSPVLYAHVDRDHLREVVDNLVENAIKYTPQGRVEVDVAVDAEDHIIIIIKDSGIGIPAEDLPHLFQKFYRVDNSDTREIGGTGLGLYLCRRLVESMNGRIWVDSTYRQGSTFYVELGRLSHNKAIILQEEAMQVARSKLASASTQATLQRDHTPGAITTGQLASPSNLLPGTPAPVLAPAPVPQPAQPSRAAPQPGGLARQPAGASKIV